MSALNEFKLDVDDAAFKLSKALGRDLTKTEENMVFINMLRTALGLSLLPYAIGNSHANLNKQNTFLERGGN